MSNIFKHQQDKDQSDAHDDLKPELRNFQQVYPGLAPGRAVIETIDHDIDDWLSLFIRVHEQDFGNHYFDSLEMRRRGFRSFRLPNVQEMKKIIESLFEDEYQPTDANQQ